MTKFQGFLSRKFLLSPEDLELERQLCLISKDFSGPFRIGELAVEGRTYENSSLVGDLSLFLAITL